MFVILTYDVRTSRVGKTRKTVKKYLRPVQRSVFEGFLPEGRLERLKKELLPILNCEEDSVRIYKLQSLGAAELDLLGVTPPSDSVIIQQSRFGAADAGEGRGNRIRQKREAGRKQKKRSSLGREPISFRAAPFLHRNRKNNCRGKRAPPPSPGTVL